VPVIGRGRELRETGRLLDRAEGGAGGLLTFVGASGSGKTALAEAAAGEARRRGFEVLRGSPPAGQPGRLIWAQLLRDAGGPDELAAVLLRAEAGPLDLDSAARHLASARPRLIVVDDLDRGGLEAAAMLSVVAARCAPSCTTVIATSATPLGLPSELRLAGLSQADLTEAVLVGTTGEPGAEAVGEAGTGRALWVASRGLPGAALSLARELPGLAATQDAVVHLALLAAPAAAFLDVDANLVRLLEMAAERTGAESRHRARMIAERLGLTLLLERLVPAPGEWTLGRDGDDWVLAAGGEQARLRDGRGLHYLRALLAAPGRDIPALDLAAGGAGLAAAGTGPVLDAAARDAYRRRLSALTAGLDAADRTGDHAAAERIEAERQALTAELRRAAGLAGRNRQPSSDAERARVNVTRTLRATIERIAPAAPLAAAHLRSSIRTGAACRYQPAPGGPDRWHV
jgi:hypothetical protein